MLVKNVIYNGLMIIMIIFSYKLASKWVFSDNQGIFVAFSSMAFKP